MSFTLRSNSVCYFGCKYIGQFSKINQKNTDIFANIPSLRLYRIVFGEVKNSFIGNILVYSREKAREKEKQGFRKKTPSIYKYTLLLSMSSLLSSFYVTVFINFRKLFYRHKTHCILYLQPNTGNVRNTLFASTFNDKVARCW